MVKRKPGRPKGSRPGGVHATLNRVIDKHKHNNTNIASTSHINGDSPSLHPITAELALATKNNMQTICFGGVSDSTGLRRSTRLMQKI